MEHCLTVTSCCRPCIWWYTISKMSLKNCKGETINVLSYLWLPQLKRQVWNLLSPCFSNQEIRTLLFLRCLLLTANSAVVCCSEEYSALEGNCPLRTIPAGECHKWTRGVFFLNPCHLLFPISVKEFWKPCSSPQSPIVPVAEEGSQWSKGQTNPEQRRYIESQMNGHLTERMDSGAHRAECSRTLFCRPDSSLHPFPGAMKKSALDYSTVKTSILRRK